MKILEFRLKFHWSLLLRGSINNIPALVQIMAWRRPGGKPLFEPVMVRSPTHICVPWPQWVKQKMFERDWEVSNPFCIILMGRFIFSQQYHTMCQLWLSHLITVTPLLMHWSYRSLVISHRYLISCHVMWNCELHVKTFIISLGIFVPGSR